MTAEEISPSQGGENTATDSKENMQNSNTAEEMKNQTKPLMQPYSNCEEHLTSAPLSIAILGELVFISSETDFSINKNPPKDGYKYIRYPDSFRACLMQVCNSGWGAFNDAHKNMDQIRLHTMNVPNYMKTAVKILFQGNDEVAQAHLPYQLENIRVIADDCLDLAASTEKRFTDVINIIQELLETCVNAEHFYGEELDMVKNKLEENKIRKQSSEEAVLETRSDTQGYITSADEVDKINIYSKSAEILACAEMFQRFVHDSTIDWRSLRVPKKYVKRPLASVMNWQNMHQRGNVKKDVSKAPMMFKEESKSEKKSASERASENARFRIEQSRAQLKETRGFYERSVENMEKNQKELTELLISMRNCGVKEIDFNTIMQMLVKGMDAMGRVKEQWEKMVQLFSMVSNIVKTSLTRTLKNFVSTSENTQSLYYSKLFSKDLQQATNIASLGHMISATYTDVSGKYLMDRVSSLGKLMTMDKEKPEFKQERLQLQNSCDEAQKAILRLVLKNKNDFERKTNVRLEKIDKEYSSSC
ncbi:uncharacterized protein LOC111190731 [Astyanax mexicanus]|uniref:uncharacterized protein LOC111190731 n=1 Tax=Astyanax mexicanus TaxID=7994 RepID=UPI0020CB2B07|nr:uncharacterized protein LOC111190731 [Astyanax mexicanus]